MNSYINIICHKKNKEIVKEEMDCFFDIINGSILSNDEKEYWKDNNCIQLMVGFKCSKHTVIELKSIMLTCFSGIDAISTSSNKNNLEFAFYPTILDIIQNNKYFIVLNISNDTI